MASAYVTIEELAALEPLPDDVVTALEAKVDEMVTTYNAVQMRLNHGVFIEFGDALLRRGEFERAHEMYLKGLQWEPLHLEGQLKAAELELMFGMPERAVRRLAAVLLRSEDVHQLMHALYLLAKHPVVEEDTLVIPDRFDLVLQVLPIGQVAEQFAYAVQRALEQKFRVTIEVLSPVEMPAGIRTRSSLLRRAQLAVEDIEERVDEAEKLEFYRSLDIGADGPQTDEETLRVLRGLSQFVENSEQAWEYLQQQAYDQYNAAEMLAFVDQYSVDNPLDANVIGILGIMERDMYADGFNYVISNSRRATSVMSVYQLYYPHEDTIGQGLHRTIVSAMYAYARMLQLPTPSDFCAENPAGAMSALDQRPQQFCRETIEGIIEYYGEFDSP